MPALQPQYKTISLEQYETLPEDIRTEVFDGQICYMASPSQLNIQYDFFSTVKVNIYEDLYVNFTDIANLLNV